MGSLVVAGIAGLQVDEDAGDDQNHQVVPHLCRKCEWGHGGWATAEDGMMNLFSFSFSFLVLPFFHTSPCPRNPIIGITIRRYTLYPNQMHLDVPARATPQFCVQFTTLIAPFASDEEGPERIMPVAKSYLLPYDRL